MAPVGDTFSGPTLLRNGALIASFVDRASASDAALAFGARDATARFDVVTLPLRIRPRPCEARTHLSPGWVQIVKNEHGSHSPTGVVYQTLAAAGRAMVFYSSVTIYA